MTGKAKIYLAMVQQFMRVKVCAKCMAARLEFREKILPKAGIGDSLGCEAR
jgi:hypothetical protein